MEDLSAYYGRLFVEEQLPSNLRRMAQSLPAMRQEGSRLFCNRCGSQIDKEQLYLPIGAYYCSSCLILGRVRSDQSLYYFPQQPFSSQQALLWQGQLTPWQAKLSKELCQAITCKRDVLVHAVTGAGKTEIIYELLAQELFRGHAICIATPRIDVCLELHARLSRDFSCPISLLHGQGEPYFRTPLVIATTHQLLKFYHAFDLLVIDEVDAFPYVDNSMLYQAVDRSLKEGGRKVFLTATSTDELDGRVRQKELHRLSLPRRFHQNPLVIPEKIWLNSLAKSLARGRLPRKLIRFIRKQRQTGYPLLIFAPEISMGQLFSEILQAIFPDEKVAFVSSQTKERIALINSFRDGTVNILISTTILERGVTFPRVDVFVLEANHRLYTKSSLIQIGGRVGRSKERPTGLLYFFHNGSNRAMAKAIAEIKEMNKESGLC